MSSFLFQKQWNWMLGGIILGGIFTLAIFFVKPIGVSTQFVILDGFIWEKFSSDLIVSDENAKYGYSSSNVYLDKSGGKYAKNVDNPMNYSFIFILSMLFGGFVAARMVKTKDSQDDMVSPKIWMDSFGSSSFKRYCATFVGGILVLFGARLAGGCTSGHMMSGMMQTSISGYIFALSVFIVAIPLAFLLYKKG